MEKSTGPAANDELTVEETPIEKGGEKRTRRTVKTPQYEEDDELTESSSEEPVDYQKERHEPKLDVFKGNPGDDWEMWLPNFGLLARTHKWTTKHKATLFALAMKGEAEQLMWTMFPNMVKEKPKYKALLRKFTKNYAPLDRVETRLAEFRNR